MARARNLKPGFFANADLAECSPWGRLLFAGLWVLADRAGRLEDRPRQIKGEIFRFDPDVDVNAELDDLRKWGFIVRYQHEGRGYIQIVNFGKHQNPHIKEAPSTIPAPHQTWASTVPAPCENGSSPADSLLLNPSPDSLSPTPAPSALFARFWDAYPLKKSKGQAEKAFRKINPNEQLLAAILAGLQRAVTSDRRFSEARYTPHASTWLNALGWEDTHRADEDEQIASTQRLMDSIAQDPRFKEPAA